MNSDFDFGNLIYIIATVVALIAGVFGKKKKPKNVAPAGGKGSRQTFLEKLESQLSGLAGEVSLAPEGEGYAEEEYDFAEEAGGGETVAFEASEASTEYVSPFAHYEGEFNPSREANKDLINSEAISTIDEDDALQLVDLDGTEYAAYDEVVDEFELGTAVLYSSILERPEY